MTTASTDLASATTLVDRLRQQRQAGLIETHISWVLLDGQDAWKLKKPLHLPFLDASTLARRHQLCEEELRLNRRMAPSLYLDVTPITGTPDAPVLGGTGPAIEYAVHMRQFPEGALLGELLEAGQVQPTQLDDFARHLVDFHRSAEVDAYQRDGAVCLRGVLTPDEVTRLRRGLDANLATPSPRAIVASRQTGLCLLCQRFGFIHR